MVQSSTNFGVNYIRTALSRASYGKNVYKDTFWMTLFSIFQVFVLIFSRVSLDTDESVGINFR